MTSPTELFAVVTDVGGTHIRFGALTSSSAQLQCIESYDCRRFNGVDSAIAHYLASLQKPLAAPATPSVLCLALPGDVQVQPVRLVNLPWVVDTSSLAERFACRVLILNDFSAQAQAIPCFPADELEWLRPPVSPPEGLNRAIIGPGTGLGVAALLPDGQVVESEGGHISFAPQTRRQQELLTALWNIYPRLSAERLVSGPGLANIYRGLSLLAGQSRELTPEQITTGAMEGEPLCLESVTVFTQLYGSISGDLALAFAAKGGIYLSGGLLQGLGNLFDKQCFLEHFHNKGRYRDYCEQIPIALVRSSYPGLLGAARFVQLQAH
jgi:glucokinase